MLLKILKNIMNLPYAAAGHKGGFSLIQVLFSLSFIALSLFIFFSGLTNHLWSKSALQSRKGVRPIDHALLELSKEKIYDLVKKYDCNLDNLDYEIVKTFGGYLHGAALTDTITLYNEGRFDDMPIDLPEKMAAIYKNSIDRCSNETPGSDYDDVQNIHTCMHILILGDSVEDFNANKMKQKRAFQNAPYKHIELDFAFRDLRTNEPIKCEQARKTPSSGFIISASVYWAAEIAGKNRFFHKHFFSLESL